MRAMVRSRLTGLYLDAFVTVDQLKPKWAQILEDIKLNESRER